MTNLLDLFGELTEEFAFESNLLFVKKDERIIVALAEPSMYNGKLAMGAKVVNDYKGKPSPQVLMKVILIPFDSSGKMEDEKMQVKGLIVSPSVAFQIAKAYEESQNNPTEDSKVLCAQKANLISIMKTNVNKKVTTSITLTSKLFDLPDDIWAEQKEVDLQSLVDSYYEMKNKMSDKETENKEDDTTPF